MLDTNIVSDLVRNPQGAVMRHIVRVGPEAVCVSIITAAELRYGCARKGSAKLLANVEAILGSVQILAFDVPADAEYGGALVLAAALLRIDHLARVGER